MDTIPFGNENRFEWRNRTPGIARACVVACVVGAFFPTLVVFLGIWFGRSYRRDKSGWGGRLTLTVWAVLAAIVAYAVSSFISISVAWHQAMTEQNIPTSYFWHEMFPWQVLTQIVKQIPQTSAIAGLTGLVAYLFSMTEAQPRTLSSKVISGLSAAAIAEIGLLFFSFWMWPALLADYQATHEAAAESQKNQKAVWVMINAPASAQPALGLSEAFARSGVDVNQKDVAGTPLVVAAATAGNVQAIELLVSHGVNIDATDAQGNNALTAVFEHPNSGRANPAMAKLLEHGCKFPIAFDKGSCLIQAINGGDIALAKALFSRGVGAEPQPAASTSPLIEAIRRENVVEPNSMYPPMPADYNPTDLIKLCLDHGGEKSLDFTDHGQYTALTLACSKHDEDLVKSLLAHGASVNPNVPAMPPIFGVLGNRSWEDVVPLKIIDLLVNAGADMNVHINGETSASVLEYACEGMHKNTLATVKHLIAGGANPNRRFITANAEYRDAKAYIDWQDRFGPTAEPPPEAWRERSEEFAPRQTKGRRPGSTG